MPTRLTIRCSVGSSASRVPLALGLALALAGSAAYSEPARAGTATSRSGCSAEGRVCGSNTVYRADPGERNDVSVSSEPGAYVISDAGVVVRAAGQCTSLDPHRARCVIGSTGPSGGSTDVSVLLGDLDDRASALATASIRGGAGDDVLYAGVPAGPAGAGLYGGPGADVLIGSPLDDFLDGGTGDDRLVGGNGRDDLDGGGGANRLDGGAGDDELSPGDSRSTRSSAQCGSGRDEIRATAPQTLVAPDCERVRVGLYLQVSRVPRVGRRRAVFRATGCDRRACGTGAVEAVVAGRRIGTGRARGRGPFSLRLNGRGRRLVARGRPLTVRLRWRKRGEPLRYGYTTRWPSTAGATLPR